MSPTPHVYTPLHKIHSLWIMWESWAQALFSSAGGQHKLGSFYGNADRTIFSFVPLRSCGLLLPPFAFESFPPLLWPWTFQADGVWWKKGKKKEFPLFNIGLTLCLVLISSNIVVLKWGVAPCLSWVETIFLSSMMKALIRLCMF